MNSAGRVIVTAVSTFVAGVAMGLLVSPNSGTENRRMVAKKIKEQSKRFEDQVKDLDQRFSDLEKSIVETGTEIAERLKTSTREAVDNVVIGPDEGDWSVEGKELATDLKRMPRK